MDPEYSDREQQYVGADSPYSEPQTPYTDRPVRPEAPVTYSRWSSRHLLLAAAGLALVVAILLAVILARPANRYPVAMSGHFGYIDHSGKIAIPAQFTDAGLFDEGLAPVKMGKSWGDRKSVV